ncbi:MAG: orotidine-5'-phosphate decarboxylase [Promethearchaeota archaeon]|nr:MAG: orotidine-5'-phosphate decarboxylase [Candidatus Lokiarchaeota archaeon]
MSFVQQLIEQIQDKKSVVCLGLDPRLDTEGQIPKYLIEENRNPNETILEFNKALIDHTYDLIPIVKPNIAFYERYDAIDALKKTIKYAEQKGVLTLLDSKRNDIGSTCEAYAYANFKVYKAQACTVNGYFGIDGIKPFLDYTNKGIFVLVKTSNPSSQEFQDLFSIKKSEIANKETELQIDSVRLERNYIHMARLIQEWSKELNKFQGYHNLGIVVGATFSHELKRIREIARNSIILLPGYGAQGATAKDIQFAFDNKGLGGIVNSSRGIMFAYNKSKKYSPDQFPEAAREEIKKMNFEINKFISL